MRAMRAQRACWEGCDSYPVLMLNHDQIWTEADRLAAFAGIDVERFRAALAPRRRRASEVAAS